MAYAPSSNATAGDPWDAAFLSDRDVSSQVPVNFVPQAGVILTPTCFNDGVYEDNAAQRCLSNLIASELRRFVIDLYWNPMLRIFQLCPVQVPMNTNNVTTDNIPADQSTDEAVVFSSAEINSQMKLFARQTGVVTNSTATSTTSTNGTASVTSSAAVPPPASTTTSTGSVLLQLNQYQCSPSLSLETLVAVFEAYYDSSANDIEARLHFVILNLHVAQPYASSNSTPATLTSAELPSGEELLSSKFRSLEEYVYTPTRLAEDRENLNASWYRRPDSNLLPLNSYFNTETLPNGAIRTFDGWPNQNFVQNYAEKRVFLGFGTIDQQIAAYDFGADGTVFPPGDLYALRDIQLSQDGQITSGCFYEPNVFDLGQVNSSFAVAGLTSMDVTAVYAAADNLTACGISPVLNSTLDEGAADDRPFLYQQFGNEAIFSWAYDEPKDDSDAPRSVSSGQFRCALMVANSDYEGHWKVENCRARYPVACRVGNEPYEWRISNNTATYYDSSRTCSDGTRFDVPRTGLENTYLHQSINSLADLSVLNGVWINFNSLNVESCWVTTGVEGQCPYMDADVRERQILIPALGALIVIVMTILTILVKCNSNRRNSKIRRRGEGGWDYEGVPS